MARRLFPDNDAWPQETSLAGNNVADALVSLLAILEEDGPVDLRDFHFLVSEAAGSFVASLSIRRRLSGDDSATPDRPYFTLHPQDKDDYKPGDELLTPEQLACLEA